MHMHLYISVALAQAIWLKPFWLKACPASHPLAWPLLCFPAPCLDGHTLPPLSVLAVASVSADWCLALVALFMHAAMAAVISGVD